MMINIPKTIVGKISRIDIFFLCKALASVQNLSIKLFFLIGLIGISNSNVLNNYNHKNQLQFILRQMALRRYSEGDMQNYRGQHVKNPFGIMMNQINRQNNSQARRIYPEEENRNIQLGIIVANRNGLDNNHMFIIRFLIAGILILMGFQYFDEDGCQKLKNKTQTEEFCKTMYQNYGCGISNEKVNEKKRPSQCVQAQMCLSDPEKYKTNKDLEEWNQIKQDILYYLRDFKKELFWAVCILVIYMGLYLMRNNPR